MIPSHCRSKIPDCFGRIKELSANTNWREVLVHYRQLKRLGNDSTNPSVFPLILKACSYVSFNFGTSIHGFLVKKGFESHTSISNSTMAFYSKWGCLDSAATVFLHLCDRDSISWNIMVYNTLDQGSLQDGLRWFGKTRLDGFGPNDSTLVLVIQACRNLGARREARMLHGYSLRSGCLAVHSVQNMLLSVYADGDMYSARTLFEEMPKRDVITWSVMVKGYVFNNKAEFGLLMFAKMVSEVEPDEVTVVSVLKACASLSDIRIGTLVQGLAIRRGLDCDMFVGNSLIDMYSKCSESDSALNVFNDMRRRNKVSWNSLISGFVQNEKNLEALSLFNSMKKDGIEPDEVTLVSVLQICKHFTEPLGLKSVHCVVLRKRYESNEVVLNSVIDAYAKSGFIDYAKRIFNSTGVRSVVLWSTMIKGFTIVGRTDEAICMFEKMVRAQEKPSSVTIVNLIEACSVSAELKRAKWAHAIAMTNISSPEDKVSIETAILEMYSKCGDIESCKSVFTRICDKNSTTTWNVMISAYGLNGLSYEALALLDEMKLRGVKINSRTALCVLSACSHGGLVEEGISFYKSMTQVHKIEPGLNHCSCMVDMLGRAGKIEAAMEFITQMSGRGLMAGAKAWGSLLSACKRYENAEIGSEAGSRVVELEPLSLAGYLMASSVYASGGLWTEVGNMRRMVKERGVKLMPGYSEVHVGNNASCRFVAGDYSHKQKYGGVVVSMVEFLHVCMKMDDHFNFGIAETTD